MKPLVTVITPYRDDAPFLEQAIASVDEQILPQWELLLIDDGSTNESRAVADAAAARDNRIRNIERPDRSRGAAAARNLGLAQAAGEFVVFLDADDRFLPEKLEVEVELMRRFPDAEMTCGASEWWYPGNEYRNWSDEIRSLRAGVYQPPFLFNFAILLQRAHVTSLCAIMVRRRALPTAPSFEPTLTLYEDQSFIAKILCEWPVYVGAHKTALYRQHPTSASALARDHEDYNRMGRHPARGKFLAWARAYLEARPELLRKSSDALLAAEAIQTGDYSQLRSSERRKLMMWKVRKVFTGPPRHFCGWLKRRYLQVRLQRGLA